MKILRFFANPGWMIVLFAVIHLVRIAVVPVFGAATSPYFFYSFLNVAVGFWLGFRWGIVSILAGWAGGTHMMWYFNVWPEAYTQISITYMAKDAVMVWGFARLHTTIDRLRVARKEAEIAREREQEARREAERANELKDHFMARLSHELRTPLSVILWWTNLYAKEGLEGVHPKAMEAVSRNAAAMEFIVKDLLDISAIRTGKLVIKKEPIDLVQVVTEAIEAVKVLIEEKGIKLSLNFSPGRYMTYADPVRMKQVVWNLLSNAVKFAPHSAGRIDISLFKHGGFIELKVKDNGRGISKEFLPYVFESFRQEDPAYTREYQGLGLGLTLVKYFVDQHGGTVEVKSDGHQKGACFIVRVPRTL